MTIIKHLINYSNEFIQGYEDWFNRNFDDLGLLWDYVNLMEYFKYSSNYKIHCLVCHKHVTVEHTTSCEVNYFTGEDAYKNALKFIYDLHNCSYDFAKVSSYSEYDVYPYYF